MLQNNIMVEFYAYIHSLYEHGALLCVCVFIDATLGHGSFSNYCSISTASPQTVKRFYPVYPCSDFNKNIGNLAYSETSYENCFFSGQAH